MTAHPVICDRQQMTLMSILWQKEKMDVMVRSNLLN